MSSKCKKLNGEVGHVMHLLEGISILYPLIYTFLFPLLLEIGYLRILFVLLTIKVCDIFFYLVRGEEQKN